MACGGDHDTLRQTTLFCWPRIEGVRAAYAPPVIRQRSSRPSCSSSSPRSSTQIDSIHVSGKQRGGWRVLVQARAPQHRHDGMGRRPSGRSRGRWKIAGLSCHLFPRRYPGRDKKPPSARSHSLPIVHDARQCALPPTCSSNPAKAPSMPPTNRTSHFEAGRESGVRKKQKKRIERSYSDPCSDEPLGG